MIIIQGITRRFTDNPSILYFAFVLFITYNSIVVDSLQAHHFTRTKDISEPNTGFSNEDIDPLSAQNLLYPQSRCEHDSLCQPLPFLNDIGFEDNEDYYLTMQGDLSHFYQQIRPQTHLSPPYPYSPPLDSITALNKLLATTHSSISENQRHPHSAAIWQDNIPFNSNHHGSQILDDKGHMFTPSMVNQHSMISSHLEPRSLSEPADDATPGYPINIDDPSIRTKLPYITLDIHGEQQEYTPDMQYTATLDLVVETSIYRRDEATHVYYHPFLLVLISQSKCTYYHTSMTSREVLVSALFSGVGGSDHNVLRISWNSMQVFPSRTYVSVQCQIVFTVNQYSTTGQPVTRELQGLFPYVALVGRSRPLYDEYKRFPRNYGIIKSPLFRFAPQLTPYNLVERYLIVPNAVTQTPLMFDFLVQDLDFEAQSTITLRFNVGGVSNPFTFYTRECGDASPLSLECDLDDLYLSLSEWTCQDDNGNPTVHFKIESIPPGPSPMIVITLLKSIQWDGTPGSTRVRCGLPLYFHVPATIIQVLDGDGIVLNPLISTQLYSIVRRLDSVRCHAEASYGEDGVAMDITVTVNEEIQTASQLSQLINDASISILNLGLIEEHTGLFSDGDGQELSVRPSYMLIGLNQYLNLLSLDSPYIDDPPRQINHSTPWITVRRSILAGRPVDASNPIVLTRRIIIPYTSLDSPSQDPSQDILSEIHADTPYRLDISFKLYNSVFWPSEGPVTAYIRFAAIPFIHYQGATASHTCQYTNSDGNQADITLDITFDPQNFALSLAHTDNNRVNLIHGVTCNGILIRTLNLFNRFSTSYVSIVIGETTSGEKQIYARSNSRYLKNISLTSLYGAPLDVPFIHTSRYVVAESPSQKVPLYQQVPIRFRVSSILILLAIFKPTLEIFRTSSESAFYLTFPFMSFVAARYTLHYTYYDPNNNFKETSISESVSMVRDKHLDPRDALYNLPYISTSEVTLEILMTIRSIDEYRFAYAMSHSNLNLGLFVSIPFQFPPVIDAVVRTAAVFGPTTPTYTSVSSLYRIRFDITTTLEELHRIIQPYRVHAVDHFCLRDGTSDVVANVLIDPPNDTYQHETILITIGKTDYPLECTFYADVFYNTNPLDDLTATLYIKTYNFEVNNHFTYPIIDMLPPGIRLRPTSSFEEIEITTFNSIITPGSTISLIFFQPFPSTLVNGTQVPINMNHIQGLSASGDDPDITVTYLDHTIGTLLESPWIKDLSSYLALDSVDQSAQTRSALSFIKMLDRFSTITTTMTEPMDPSTNHLNASGYNNMEYQLNHPLTLVVVTLHAERDTTQTTIRIPLLFDHTYHPTSISYYYASISETYLCGMMHMPSFLNQYDFTFEILPTESSFTILQFAVVPLLADAKVGNLITVDLRRSGLPLNDRNTCGFTFDGDHPGSLIDTHFSYQKGSKYILSISLPAIEKDQQLSVICRFVSSQLSTPNHAITAYLSETASGTYIAASAQSKMPVTPYNDPIHHTYLHFDVTGYYVPCETVNIVNHIWETVTTLLSILFPNISLSNIQLGQYQQIKSYESPGRYYLSDLKSWLGAMVFIMRMIGFPYDYKLVYELQYLFSDLSYLRQLEGLSLYDSLYPENSGTIADLCRLIDEVTEVNPNDPSIDNRGPAPIDDSTRFSYVFFQSTHFQSSVDIQLFGEFNITQLNRWYNFTAEAHPTLLSTFMIELREIAHLDITEKACLDGFQCGISCGRLCPTLTPCKSDFDCLTLYCSRDTQLCQEP